MSGSSILIALPILAFLLLFIFLLGREEGPTRDWRRAFVLASVGWGVYLALVSEVLSLVDGLTLAGVAVAWLVPAAVLAYRVQRSGALPASWGYLRAAASDLSGPDKMILSGVWLICGALFAIAVISPPNTYDSALYHMARVVHWAQDASLRPYPALFEHQLHKPIWAETAILHLRILWGDDRPAALIQWFSMMGSLVAASGIVSLLGGRRSAQLLAVGCAVSIPMGILQASSTLNDYVAAYWAIALAYLVVLAHGRRLSRWELGALAGSVGLAVLTKGTAFVYAPPFVAWFLLRDVARRGFGRAFVAGVAIAVVVVVLNLGFWARNIQVFGGPYGTSEWLQQNLWIRFLQQPAAQSPGGAGEEEANPDQPSPTAVPASLQDEPPPPGTPQVAAPPGGYLNRLAQTAGRNLTMPTGFLSRPVLAAVGSYPALFGTSYVDELRFVSWNHEDFAGNPLHLLSVPLALVLLLALAWRRVEARPAALYAGVALLTYAMIPIVIGHGPSIYGIRYQLSFFVLWAPAVGLAFGFVGGERVLRILTVGFLLAAVPYVVLNKTRPLIGMPPQRTLTRSILVEDPKVILIPWNRDLSDDYAMAAEAVEASGCTRVALRAGGAFPEYPVWWLLDAPQSGIHIESFDSPPYLAMFVDRDFHACAVICANCDTETSLRGLPLYGIYDSMKVYLRK